ncbi:hypothetical protein ACFL1H_04925 [Nanoarchaeota archaeon]
MTCNKHVGKLADMYANAMISSMINTARLYQESEQQNYQGQKAGYIEEFVYSKQGNNVFAYGRKSNPLDQKIDLGNIENELDYFKKSKEMEGYKPQEIMGSNQSQTPLEIMQYENNNVTDTLDNAYINPDNNIDYSLNSQPKLNEYNMNNDLGNILQSNQIYAPLIPSEISSTDRDLIGNKILNTLMQHENCENERTDLITKIFSELKGMGIDEVERANEFEKLKLKMEKGDHHVH